MELLAIETGIFTATLAASTGIIGALLGVMAAMVKRNGNGNGSRVWDDIHAEAKAHTREIGGLKEVMIRVETVLRERLPRGQG